MCQSSVKWGLWKRQLNCSLWMMMMMMIMNHQNRTSSLTTRLAPPLSWGPVFPGIPWPIRKGDSWKYCSWGWGLSAIPWSVCSSMIMWSHKICWGSGRLLTGFIILFSSYEGIWCHIYMIPAQCFISIQFQIKELFPVYESFRRIMSSTHNNIQHTIKLLSVTLSQLSSRDWSLIRLFGGIVRWLMGKKEQI